MSDIAEIENKLYHALNDPVIPRKSLFAVTTLAQHHGPGFGGTRCIAICTTLKRAQEILEKDEGSLWETTYDYAVIEETMLDQVYPETPNVYWYKWQKAKNPEDVYDGRYVPIKRPPTFYKRIINFGIG